MFAILQIGQSEKACALCRDSPLSHIVRCHAHAAVVAAAVDDVATSSP